MAGHINVVRHLVEKKANINIKNMKGVEFDLNLHFVLGLQCQNIFIWFFLTQTV